MGGCQPLPPYAWLSERRNKNPSSPTMDSCSGIPAKCNKVCECMGMFENIPCKTIPGPQNDGQWKLATHAVIIISVPSATLKVAIILAIMVMVSKYQQLSTCISNQCNLWSYPRRFQQGIEPWDSQEVFHLLSSITTNVASPALSIHIPSVSYDLKQ